MENEKSKAGELVALEGYLRSLIKVKEIIPKKKYAIEFPMYGVPDYPSTPKAMYKFFLVRKNNVFYLMDNGATYKELDLIFDLKAEDVQENLNAIMRLHGCVKLDNNVAIECHSPEDVDKKLSSLIQAISFMLSMKMFYN